MSTRSKIEWTNRTWNPVTGCTKVSQGCKNCYAEREWARLSANPKSVYYGREFTDVMIHPERISQPLHWRKPSLVFVNSMSDLFHEDVPFEVIAVLMWVMRRASRHTFQILTKRPERALEYVDWGAKQELPKDYAIPDNVWLGVSIEDQATADERIPLLMRIPAAVRFVSAEPLLGAVDLTGIFIYPKVTFKRGTPAPDSIPVHALKQIQWLIVGGESGPDARPMHPDWARSLRDQAVAAGVPFFFKQWGEYFYTLVYDDAKFSGGKAFKRCNGCTSAARLRLTSKRAFTSGEYVNWEVGMQNITGDIMLEGNIIAERVGKKSAGRLLDGREWNEYPRAWKRE